MPDALCGGFTSMSDCPSTIVEDECPRAARPGCCMKTMGRVGAWMFGAVILSGCAAYPIGGPQVRAHATPAASAHYMTSQQIMTQISSKSKRQDSPLAQACKSGGSKACNELGDRLVLKHAYAEARQWYVTSCERVRNAMVPTAARVLQLSRELTLLDRARSDDEGSSADTQKRKAALKSEASEMRSRIQGCLDVGETLKVNGELAQALEYYDVACEFSTLVQDAGEALPGLEHITDTGCAAGKAGRAELTGQTQFSPQLFADLLQQQSQPGAAKRSTGQPEAGMVFGEGDL
jgi:hypothetical protein